jgi:hypothetical protein
MPYATRTTVEASRTRLEIERLLEKAGATGAQLVDIHLPHVGTEQGFVDEMAEAGLGVAFMTRRTAYPLIAA